MRHFGLVVSAVVFSLVWACSAKKEDAPTPVPDVDAAVGGCAADPTGPGCSSSGGIDSGGDPDSGASDTGADTASVVDPSLLAGAQWTGGPTTSTSSQKMTFTGGPTSGTLTGITVTKPAMSSCGPESIRTFTWSGTWSYDGSTRGLNIVVTDSTFLRTECDDPSLDDTTPQPTTDAARTLLAEWVSGTITTLTSSSLVIGTIGQGALTMSR